GFPAVGEAAGPQRPPGPVEPDLGGRLGDAELGRDGLVWEVVHVAEHDDGPQPGRQLGDGRLDGGPQIGRHGPVEGVGGRRQVGRLGGDFERLVPVPTPTPDVRRGAVGRDAVQPRRDPGLPTEAVDAAVGPQIRLLHHVPRILLVARQPVRQGVRVVVRGPDQDLEGATITAAGGGHDLVETVAHHAIGPAGGVTGYARLPGLPVDGVPAVEPAVLLHLEALAVVELVLHRDVVAVLADLALEGDLHPLLALRHGSFPYLMILITPPAPTVRPPSPMAKRRPSSMAMGLPSSTVMLMLSPGITISVPSGRVMVPVTSVVRK